MFDQKEYHKKWLDEHREEVNRKRRERYRANPMEQAVQNERAKKWNAENRARMNESRRNRYAKGIRYKMSEEQITNARAGTRQWRKDNKETVRGYQDKRREQIRCAVKERVSKRVLWAESGGVCAICGEPIDKDIRYPDMMSLSYDHKVPLSKGGEHTMRNIQCVHRICNIRKRDHLPE